MFALWPILLDHATLTTASLLHSKAPGLQSLFCSAATNATLLEESQELYAARRVKRSAKHGSLSHLMILFAGLGLFAPLRSCLAWMDYLHVSCGSVILEAISFCNAFGLLLRISHLVGSMWPSIRLLRF